MLVKIFGAVLANVHAVFLHKNQVYKKHEAQENLRNIKHKQSEFQK